MDILEGKGLGTYLYTLKLTIISSNKVGWYFIVLVYVDRSTSISKNNESTIDKVNHFIKKYIFVLIFFSLVKVSNTVFFEAFLFAFTNGN